MRGVALGGQAKGFGIGGSGEASRDGAGGKGAHHSVHHVFSTVGTCFS
jgi:hypothetical protein